MKINSIRFKTSVLGTCILSVVLILFSAYLVHTIRQILYKEEEEELLVKAQEIDEFIDAYAKISQEDKSPAMLFYQLLGGKGLADKTIVDQLWEKDSKALGLKNDFYRIRNSKGEVILRSENLTIKEDESFNAQFARFGNTIHFSRLKINGNHYYAINYPITFSNLNTLNLQLAMPIKYIQRVIYRMVFAIIGGIVFILLMSILMGVYLTRRVLMPVENVIRAADHITQKNLNMRIPIKELDKEMEELVKSINRMIERLENSFSYINDFNSHVSHEMKTPLAIIKGELELALSAESTKQEDRRVMTDVLYEVNRLIKTITDLLLLSKYEYKLEIFKMERMDLTEFINKIYQNFKILAQEKNINLELLTPNDPLWIEGDPTHLRRVFFNLIHNAVKFTPAGGEIKILTELFNKYAVVSIQDTGIGIAIENQAKIFDKFYRIRPMKQESAEGNGLGLSMARAIARAHKGDITFDSELNKGSTFKVFLPVLLN
ncbi:MAG: HAMP domain-containing protein [Candidatus Omnitrophica bacterium]|nr:HAMP domain-containing protein [Candidatus Omnitrophota bacterium]